MPNELKKKITETLRGIHLPDQGDDIVSQGMIDSLHIEDGHAMITLKVDPKQGTRLESLRQQVEQVIGALDGIRKATAVLTAERPPAETKKTSDQEMLARPIAPGIKHIIAVASGKGGVGKSTVAANLAAALAVSGYKTGLVDADIYGPSQHRMMGIKSRAQSTEDRRLIPETAHGLKVISMGLMVDEDRPMIWRGPMVQTAVLQFFRDVDWGDTEVLVVDLPPGTGDVQMTMAQKIPLTGAVIVSTPQDIALIDARKGLNMFIKMEVPVLGIIENMSQHICSNCGHIDHIFGHGGARAEAEKLNLPYLGEVPLDITLRQSSDGGTPLVLKDPDHPASLVFRDMADRVLNSL